MNGNMIIADPNVSVEFEVFGKVQGEYMLFYITSLFFLSNLKVVPSLNIARTNARS